MEGAFVFSDQFVSQQCLESNERTKGLIHGEIEEWFSMIGLQLHDPFIDSVSDYSMDGTGVMLHIERILEEFCPEISIGCLDPTGSSGSVARRLAYHAQEDQIL